MARILHHLFPWRFARASVSCALNPCTDCGGEGQGYFPPCAGTSPAGGQCSSLEIFSLSLWKLQDSKHLNQCLCSHLTCGFS